MILILNRDGSITKKIWNSDLRQDELKPMEAIDVLAYLMETVELAEGFTVRDYFKIVEKHEMLHLLDHYFEPFLEEVRKCPAEGCTDSDHVAIEFRKYVSADFGDDAHISMDYSLICKTPDEHTTPDENGYTHYGISFVPMSKLLDVPITFGKLGIHRISNKKAEEFSYEFITYYSLWDFIRGFIWEISFYGVPEERDAQKEELMDRVESIQNGTAQLLSLEEVMDNLNITTDLDAVTEKGTDNERQEDVDAPGDSDSAGS